MGYKLKIKAFNDLLQALENEYEIWAPKRFIGKGSFADTDYIRYDQVHDYSTMELTERSHSSAKEVVFPITQTILYFDETGYRVPQLPSKEKLVIARACDITGIHRLDTLYQKNGDPDFYYNRLREKVHFIILECPHSFRSCFCKSMGGDQTDDFVMGMTVKDQEIYLELNGDTFTNYLEGVESEQVDYTFTFPQHNDVTVTPPDVDDMPRAIFEHPMWETYDRCIDCGRCNLNCPTCTCFTTTDLFYNENKTVGERRRVWSSCHFKKFTDMAGGHSFRNTQRERGRFHVLHKVYDFRKRFHQGNMCVGCGRCEESCPKYISYIDAVNTLTKVLKEEYLHEK
ncbi:anaerobic sulfite reductase subunit AsrA [Niameybacter massiliensis]|uniref:Anaerobic sulfite reductase subunit AsrA n=1 Tax=Holtiella tumoricola TaxID=3018743 RepID=A0AA42J0X7_9FIRM|nr:anaerobic sulfite reductase subunit AsrA [Holtiella tumoricola]MDA3731611.1 anaerobic sulfite reductase subunit AsrA [Holtiella tumoricola]